MCPWVHPGWHSTPPMEGRPREATLTAWQGWGPGAVSLPCIHARGFKPRQVQGETYWRDVSARFSFIAKAMALPPSSYSRFAAKLEARDRECKSQMQSLGQLQ